jgi:hypothetical protein
MFLVFLTVIACDEGSTRTAAKPAAPKPAAQQISLEYKLATIDKGYVSNDDVSIARFRSLLQQLDTKYSESKQQIADMSVKAQSMLRDKGLKESLLNIMEGMNKLFSSPADLIYAEYMAAYVTLRDGGQSHNEAIKGLQTILQSLGIY